MKKNFFLKSSLGMLIFSLFVSAFVSSCGKKSDPSPAPDATAKVFTAYVTPTTNSGTANVTGAVTNSDGNAYLRLVVTSTTNIDHVYITTSNDNGAMAPYIGTSDYTDSLKNTFKAGTSEVSYTTSNTKSFILMVPVSIRTTSAAVSDVYTVWFTNGKGNFLLPTKNRILGPVTFTLNYGSNTSASFSTVKGVSLGDQNAAPGSLLVTSGQVSALLTAAYDSSATSADLSLSELNSAGTARTGGTGYTGGAFGSGSLWLISPNLREGVGYKNEPGSANSNFVSTSPNVTYISVATNVDFDAVTGATLSSLSVGQTQKVQIVNGGIYQFITATGKKGLIRVTSVTQATSSAGGTATVDVKVLN